MDHYPMTIYFLRNQLYRNIKLLMDRICILTICYLIVCVQTNTDLKITCRIKTDYISNE